MNVQIGVYGAAGLGAFVRGGSFEFWFLLVAVCVDWGFRVYFCLFRLLDSGSVAFVAGLSLWHGVEFQHGTVKALRDGKGV